MPVYWGEEKLTEVPFPMSAYMMEGLVELRTRSEYIQQRGNKLDLSKGLLPL